tara:strand:- start:58 stop:528 length:471 start_codon:yes stop_codon:yes gene_type:complete
MKNNYINIYNNLINLTRNKSLYENLNSEETFSSRLTFYLFHFAFFLKVYKNEDKDLLQDIYDYNFRQLEISIREIGYGDVAINKKMKDYLNLFHKVILEIEDWEKKEVDKKKQFILNYLNINSNSGFFIDYFEKYLVLLKNNTLNSFLNNIIELKT